MEIFIGGVTLDGPRTFVVFASEFGAARAEWQSEKYRDDPPITNERCHVEVTLDDDFVWNTNVLPTSDRRYRLWQDNTCVHLCGELESVDDDGFSILRMGPSILPFVATGTPLPLTSFIEVIAEKISLWPWS